MYEIVCNNDVRFVVHQVTHYFTLIRNRYVREFHPPLFQGGERDFLIFARTMWRLVISGFI